MVLLGAAILLHGAMPFDGDRDTASAACRTRYDALDDGMKNQLSLLYKAMCSAAAAIADLEPDLIVLHTPHGISLTDTYGVYLNNVAEGTALWNEQWNEFSVKVSLASDKSKQLVEHFRADGISAQGINSFASTEAPLRWGEAIPLWYIQKFMRKEVRYIIITQDLKPKVPSLEDWRLQVGASLAKFVDGLSERVVVAISGDLSHYHATSCTDSLYLPDPRWDIIPNSPAAIAYESAIVHWVKNSDKNSSADYTSSEQNWSPDTASSWIRVAAEADPSAGTCGGKGFVVLHGLLDAASNMRGQDATLFRSRLYGYAAPTYYGMMAATFIRL